VIVGDIPLITASSNAMVWLRVVGTIGGGISIGPCLYGINTPKFLPQTLTVWCLELPCCIVSFQTEIVHQSALVWLPKQLLFWFHSCLQCLEFNSVAGVLDTFWLGHRTMSILLA